MFETEIPLNLRKEHKCPSCKSPFICAYKITINKLKHIIEIKCLECSYSGLIIRTLSRQEVKRKNDTANYGGANTEKEL